jgi:hypothetical protein
MADALVQQREAQLENATSKKKGNKFIDSVGMTLYKYSLPYAERLELEARQSRDKWNADHDDEEQIK